MGSHGLPWSTFIDPHYDGIQIRINNSFLFRINNFLPCQDLNPGPGGTKQIHTNVLPCFDVPQLFGEMIRLAKFWFS